MKKLNLKSLLAMLLTLCMLLGSVVALAEGEAAGTPAATEPTAPAATTPTVTVAAGETAGAVNVTITDDSTGAADSGVEINAVIVYNEDDDGNETKTPATFMYVNDDYKLIDETGEKLIDGATDLVVNAGNIAVNMTNPVVDWTESVYDDEDNLINEIKHYTNNAQALYTYVDAEHDKINIAINAGDLYAATSAKIDNDDEATAEGAMLSVDAEGSTLKAVIGDIFAKAAAPATVATETDPEKRAQEEKDIQNSLEGSAFGLNAYTDSKTAADITAGDITATSSAVNGNAYANGAHVYAYDSTNTVAVGNVSATATSDVWSANAYGLEAGASGEGTVTVTAGDINASATGIVGAYAAGIDVEDPYKAKDVKVKTGSVNATASLVEGKAPAEEETWSSATAVGARSDNTNTEVEVGGNVNAKADKSATGIYANSESSDKVWSSKEGKEIDNPNPGKTTVTVNGDVTAEARTATGIDADSVTFNDTYNEETKKWEKDKVGGTTTVIVNGDVTAKGAADAKSDEMTFGVNAYADTHASTLVAITGDVTATGSNAIGVQATAAKEATKLDIVVDGTVTGDGVAIGAVKSYEYDSVNSEGKVDKGEKNEYDPTLANIIVWKAAENVEGRIAYVYDELETDTETKTADGKYDYNVEITRTVDEEASAKLEAAIWYIIKVADAWKDSITATGTGTYTVNDTTYDLAHQDDNVTLALNIASTKKLSAIYYNDGTKADYVKNDDGTYTIKMLRGGAMELSLKLKNKATEQAAAAATTTAAEAAEEAAEAETETAATATAAEALDSATETLESDDATVEIPGIEELLSKDEMDKFNKLSVKDRLLVALSALGVANSGNIADGMSAEAKALADEIAERLGGMDADELQKLLDLIAANFPKGTVTVDGVEYESFTIDLVTTKDGEESTESFTFYDENGTWKLYTEA